MKIAVIGANGQLGNDICLAFRVKGDDVFGFTHQDVEIGSELSVNLALGSVAPDLIINAAAFHNVDRCESETAEALHVNAIGSRNLAVFARESGALLVHISTDYVFDGNKGCAYKEEDLTCPLNTYGISKLAGEHFVRTIAPRHFVLRVAGLYGSAPCRAKGGLNFVERMLKLASEGTSIRVVADEFTTPTSTAQVAQQIVALVDSNNYGLFHATAEGFCSWFEFAKAIFEAERLRPSLTSCSSGDFAVKARRPRYSVLENAALKREGLNSFLHWRDALATYLTQRRRSHSVEMAG